MFTVSNEKKQELLTARLEALNLEGYQHELNKLSAEALGNQDVVDSSDQAIAVIVSAIEVHQAELDNLV